MKKLINVFSLAREKGLKNVSIRITEDPPDDLEFVLYVGENDRFTGYSVNGLLHALSEHTDLAWMNS